MPRPRVLLQARKVVDEAGEAAAAAAADALSRQIHSHAAVDATAGTRAARVRHKLMGRLLVAEAQEQQEQQVLLAQGPRLKSTAMLMEVVARCRAVGLGEEVAPVGA